MKKIIIIFILLAGSLFAQTASPATKKAINDSLTAMRTETAASIHDSLSAFQLNGSYWTTNSSQSSLTGTKTITSGGITFGANTKLVPPLLTQSGSHTWVEGALYQRQGNKTGYLYQDYYDASYNEKTAVFEDTTKAQTRIDNSFNTSIASYEDTTATQARIDNTLSANAVNHQVQISTDSVDFSNSNTINAYIDADVGGVTLYPKNYQAGIAQQIVVYAQGPPTISFGSITLLYESGVGITNHGTGYYRIWFTYLTDTICIVDWGFYE